MSSEVSLGVVKAEVASFPILSSSRLDPHFNTILSTKVSSTLQLSLPSPNRTEKNVYTNASKYMHNNNQYLDYHLHKILRYRNCDGSFKYSSSRIKYLLSEPKH